MRRVLGFLFVLAGASSAIARGDATSTPAKPSAATAKPPAAYTTSVTPKASAPRSAALAPADEYFGPLKMSVLGIRNEIHDLAIRYDVRADVDHALAKRIMGTAVMTEASLADWEKKYPTDNQLARDVYLLQHLYAKIEYDVAREKARYCAQWLFFRYGSSWYAKNLKMTMARDHIPIPSGAPTPVRDLEPAQSTPSTAPATTVPASAVPSATTTQGASMPAVPSTTSAESKTPRTGSASSNPTSGVPSPTVKAPSTVAPVPSPPPT